MPMRRSRVSALLVIIGLIATTATASRAKDDLHSVGVNPQALKFEPIPNMPTCVTAAILRGNPRSEASYALLKFASGCRVPMHWHTPSEDLVVISGQGTLVMKDGGPPLKFVPGAYASLPSHHMHQANCTRTCLLFAMSDGAYDIHYVDAKGDEISLEKALAQLAATTKATTTKKGTKKK